MKKEMNNIFQSIKELYLPRTSGERNFFNMHQPLKVTPDAEGNKDDVFKASNVKHSMTAANAKDHGYNSPEDVGVYDNGDNTPINQVVEDTTENAENAYRAFYDEICEELDCIVNCFHEYCDPDVLNDKKTMLGGTPFISSGGICWDCVRRIGNILEDTKRLNRMIKSCKNNLDNVPSPVTHGY